MRIANILQVDIQAAEHMGELHDALKENGYAWHELEIPERKRQGKKPTKNLTRL